jgi:hypothetical protein
VCTDCCLSPKFPFSGGKYHTQTEIISQKISFPSTSNANFNKFYRSIRINKKSEEFESSYLRIL